MKRPYMREHKSQFVCQGDPSTGYPKNRSDESDSEDIRPKESDRANGLFSELWVDYSLVASALDFILHS